MQSPQSESTPRRLTLRKIELNMDCVTGLITDYELPKVVTVPNKPLGVLKIILHFISLSFVVFYQLYYCRGYQEFSGVDSCLTTKIKGVTG